jgi:hypothetical protein
MNQDYYEKFKSWLLKEGGTILPNTNEYELIRFKGTEIGVIYKSEKVSGKFAKDTLHCFNNGKPWIGRPDGTKRKRNYIKRKRYLLTRDGDRCFYCNKPLGDDCTIEHLIPLNRGGDNKIENTVLAHSLCNLEVGSMLLNEKIEIAIKKRYNEKSTQ